MTSGKGRDEIGCFPRFTRLLSKRRERACVSLIAPATAREHPPDLLRAISSPAPTSSSNDAAKPASTTPLLGRPIANPLALMRSLSLVRRQQQQAQQQGGPDVVQLAHMELMERMSRGSRPKQARELLRQPSSLQQRHPVPGDAGGLDAGGGEAVLGERASRGSTESPGAGAGACAGSGVSRTPGPQLGPLTPRNSCPSPPAAPSALSTQQDPMDTTHSMNSSAMLAEHARDASQTASRWALTEGSDTPRAMEGRGSTGRLPLSTSTGFKASDTRHLLRSATTARAANANASASPSAGPSPGPGPVHGSSLWQLMMHTPSASPACSRGGSPCPGSPIAGPHSQSARVLNCHPGLGSGSTGGSFASSPAGSPRCSSPCIPGGKAPHPSPRDPISRLQASVVGSGASASSAASASANSRCSSPGGTSGPNPRLLRTMSSCGSSRVLTRLTSFAGGSTKDADLGSSVGSGASTPTHALAGASTHSVTAAGIAEPAASAGSHGMFGAHFSFKRGPGAPLASASVVHTAGPASSNGSATASPRCNSPAMGNFIGGGSAARFYCDGSVEVISLPLEAMGRDAPLRGGTSRRSNGSRSNLSPMGNAARQQQGQQGQQQGQQGQASKSQPLVTLPMIMQAAQAVVQQKQALHHSHQQGARARAEDSSALASASEGPSTRTRDSAGVPWDSSDTSGLGPHSAPSMLLDSTASGAVLLPYSGASVSSTAPMEVHIPSAFQQAAMSAPGSYAEYDAVHTTQQGEEGAAFSASDLVAKRSHQAFTGVLMVGGEEVEEAGSSAGLVLHCTGGDAEQRHLTGMRVSNPVFEAEVELADACASPASARQGSASNFFQPYHPHPNSHQQHQQSQQQHDGASEQWGAHVAAPYSYHAAPSFAFQHQQATDPGADNALGHEWVHEQSAVEQRGVTTDSPRSPGAEVASAAAALQASSQALLLSLAGEAAASMSGPQDTGAGTSGQQLPPQQAQQHQVHQVHQVPDIDTDQLLRSLYILPPPKGTRPSAIGRNNSMFSLAPYSAGMPPPGRDSSLAAGSSDSMGSLSFCRVAETDEDRSSSVVVFGNGTVERPSFQVELQYKYSGFSILGIMPAQEPPAGSSRSLSS